MSSAGDRGGYLEFLEVYVKLEFQALRALEILAPAGGFPPLTKVLASLILLFDFLILSFH